jgi:predicted nucleic acid-binding protein
MNAVDTNVLLYYVDKDEPAKQAKATALLADLAGRQVPCLLLSQVAVEFAAGLTRWMQKGKVSAPERQTYFQNVVSLFPYTLPKTNLVPAAFDLADRHSLSYWDAFLLAGCIEARIDTLYSEDLSDGVVYDGVKVVNPFA